MGYRVEVMPLVHPGFDLLAKKDEIELRVEVKSHVGRSNIAEITHRQYKEYVMQ